MKCSLSASHLHRFWSQHQLYRHEPSLPGLHRERCSADGAVLVSRRRADEGPAERWWQARAAGWRRSTWYPRLRGLVAHRHFSNFFMGLILVNAVFLLPFTERELEREEADTREQDVRERDRQTAFVAWVGMELFFSMAYVFECLAKVGCYVQQTVLWSASPRWVRFAKAWCACVTCNCPQYSLEYLATLTLNLTLTVTLTLTLTPTPTPTRSCSCWPAGRAPTGAPSSTASTRWRRGCLSWCSPTQRPSARSYNDSLTALQRL